MLDIVPSCSPVQYEENLDFSGSILHPSDFFVSFTSTSETLFQAMNLCNLNEN